MSVNAAFVERICLQLRARYRDFTVEPDAERRAAHLRGSGLDLRLPLGPLQHACEREPQHASALIADFVRQTEAQLHRRPPVLLATSRLLWCVRTETYLRDLSGSDRLLTRPVSGDLVAFVAETLPNAAMQGVDRSRWEAAGLTVDAVSAAADENTHARFARLPGRVKGAPRLPRDGWSLSGDNLFQGSVLLMPAFLQALTGRADDTVLLAVPDRSTVLAIPAHAEGVRSFRERVVRAYREGMNPCSRQLFLTDGATLRQADSVPKPTRTPGLRGWLLGAQGNDAS